MNTNDTLMDERAYITYHASEMHCDTIWNSLR